MSFLGRWFGNVVGKWWGPVSVEPEPTQDGGGRFQYPNWQPYIIAKRDWEKKIPPVVVQTIERIARKDTTEADALRLLEAELDAAQYQARYAQMLLALMRNQLQSLTVLRRQQLAEMARIEQEDEDDAILLMA